MGGKMSLNKGKNFEREVARMFQKIGYTEARRQLEYHIKDANGVDLQGTGNWRVQCKRYSEYVSVNKIFEIKDKSGIPLLITKADNKPAMVVLPLESFLVMLEVVKRMIVLPLGARNERTEI